MEDTTTKMFKLKLASFNCKNFHNEAPMFDFMNNIIPDCVILFIQEHWLY